VLRAVVGAGAVDRGKLRAVKGTYTGDKGKPLPRYRDALLNAVSLPQVSPVLDFLERNNLRKQIQTEKAKGK